MLVFPKIISGGQTGVDRAALDAALKHGIDCGGWCPAGRLDELGKIPERYPLKELKEGGFAERTLKNVKDSNGTVVIYFEELQGGSRQTAEFCREEKRPHELIDAGKVSVERAAESISNFVRENKIRILNIAGPRQSEWSGGYKYACRTLELFLSGLSGGIGDRALPTRNAAPLPDRDARRNMRE